MAGAGLLLWSDSSSKDSAPSLLEDRFIRDLNAYRKATASISPKMDGDEIARVFQVGDFRERAVMMAWLAGKATPKTVYTENGTGKLVGIEESLEARKAAAQLAIDFRDRFYEKNPDSGALANNVLETIKLEGEGKKSLRDVSNELIAFVTDMKEAASAAAAVTKKATMLVNFTPTITSVVDVSPNDYLQGYDAPASDGTMRGSYLAKIVDRQNAPYAGTYLVVTAPLAKENV